MSDCKTIFGGSGTYEGNHPHMAGQECMTLHRQTSSPKHAAYWFIKHESQGQNLTSICWGERELERPDQFQTCARRGTAGELPSVSISAWDDVWAEADVWAAEEGRELEEVEEGRKGSVGPKIAEMG